MEANQMAKKTKKKKNIKEVIAVLHHHRVHHLLQINLNRDHVQIRIKKAKKRKINHQKVRIQIVAKKKIKKRIIPKIQIQVKTNQEKNTKENKRTVFITKSLKEKLEEQRLKKEAKL